MRNLFTKSKIIFIVFAIVLGSAISISAKENILSLEAIEYMVQPDSTSGYQKRITDNENYGYELYNNKDYNKSLKPVIYVKNLMLPNELDTANGEGDIEFELELKIRHSDIGRTVYSYKVDVNKECMANIDSNGYCNLDAIDIDVVQRKVIDGGIEYEEIDYNDTIGNGRLYQGLPIDLYTRIEFPVFEAIFDTNVFNHIGLLELEAKITTIRNNNGEVSDSVSNDNQRLKEIYVLDIIELEFENFSIFDQTPNGAKPNTKKWTQAGATVISSDEYSLNPLEQPWPIDSKNNRYAEKLSLIQPALLLDRINDNNRDWSSIKGKASGDKITSFPIKLKNYHNGVSISVYVQRTKKKQFWNRGYGDSLLLGPEPRIYRNNDLSNPFDEYWAASHIPDSLLIEYYIPDKDESIINIEEIKWRTIKVGDKNGQIIDSLIGIPAYAIFGAGGYISPFIPYRNDTLLQSPTSGDMGYLKADINDIGFDDRLKKYSFTLPASAITDSIIRLRVRVAATNDQKCETCIPDDNDEFIIDNITLLSTSEETWDMSITALDIGDGTYSKPRSQNSEIPIKVTINNNTHNRAPFYFIKTVIYKESIENMRKWYQSLLGYSLFYDAVYCRTKSIPQHSGMLTKEFKFPSFNAEVMGPGKYTAVSIVHIIGGDGIKLNDYVVKEFKINENDGIFYSRNINDVQDFTNEFGGLSLAGTNYGGMGDGSGYRWGFENNQYSYGSNSDNSGSIAMRFTLNAQDTISGYKTFFAGSNTSDLQITYKIVKDELGKPSNEIVNSSAITTECAYDMSTNSIVRDTFAYSYLEKPLVLSIGTYWMVIESQNIERINIGANSENAGLRTMNYAHSNNLSEIGIDSRNLYIQRNQNRVLDNGDYISVDKYKYNNGIGWISFVPRVGNIAYPHLPHSGVSPVDNQTMTFSQGTWFPLISPVFKKRDYNDSHRNIENCSLWLNGVLKPENNLVELWWIPVELVSFNSRPTNRGIELMWETASEIDNYGFYVERIDVTEGIEDDWNQVAFIKGNGTTTTLSTYNHMDANVISGHTYSYRLRQVDRDGSQSCNETMVQTETYLGESAFVLETASPNPFGQTSQMTTIDYTVPAAGNVTLEIVDVFGNTVRTLVSDNIAAGSYSATWDATDGMGREVSTGSYVYRLTVNGETLTNKVQYRK